MRLFDFQFVAACGLEAHVETLHAMGKGTEGDEIYASLGIGYHGVEGDAARRFCFGTSVDDFDGLLCILRGKIVEHDAVTAFGKRLVKFLEVAHLALNLQVLALVLAILFGTTDGIVHACRRVRCGGSCRHQSSRPLSRAYACQEWSCGYRARGSWCLRR